MPPQEDNTGSLEKARKRLYQSGSLDQDRPDLSPIDDRNLPHAWETVPIQNIPRRPRPHVRLATIFFGFSVAFFSIALLAAGYFFYFGGNSVSVDKITIDIQGPTTIAGGDTVPLSLTITNRNPVAIENATIEIDFPNGTLSGDGSLSPYPRYTENLGTLASGQTITRSIKAIVFGAAGQALVMPVAFSYGTSDSNTVFVKKSSLALAISSTPLSVSVDTLAETVSGKPLTLTLTVRSNATVALDNVVLNTSFPFGFTVTDSSPKINGANFIIGTLQPGAVKVVTLTGTLSGQNGEQRVFHFSVGISKTKTDPTLAVSYMTQEASVLLAAPFLATTLALNGNSSSNIVIAPGSVQSVTVSYTNTLTTSVNNASVVIGLTGSAIDYNSIQTTSGFYRSADHSIIFSSDTDPSLSTLAPGASGIGSFTFSTLPAGASVGPSVTFSVSVSGTRVGQSNVPEQVNATSIQTFKVATKVALTSSSLHSSGSFSNSGPIPPKVGTPSTYTIVWNTSAGGSAVAGGSVTATLPSYVSYTGKTAGAGSFVYDDKSRIVTWNTGDLTPGGGVQGSFQVSITPSSSQKGTAPQLTSSATFSGYDRFAGVQVTATADPATTETKGDPGYVPANASVQ